LPALGGALMLIAQAIAIGLFRRKKSLAQLIADLFANNQQGAWYDPSDFSTLFQDSAGVTPITAVEQPVGLMLDKRLGAVRGAERITNGTFDVDANWTKGNASWTISGGVASNSGANAANAPFTQAGIFTAGSTYEISLSITRTAGSLNIWINGTQLVEATISASASKRYIIAATATGSMFFEAGIGFIGTVDNVSVKLLDGNHATQATAASRPVLSARVNLLTKSEQFNDAVWTSGKSAGASVAVNTTIAPDGTLTADTVTFAAAGDFIINAEASSTVVAIGDKRTISLHARTSVQIIIFGGATPAGTDVYSSVDAGGGWFRQQLVRTFTTAATSTIQFIPIGSFVGAGSYPIWGGQFDVGTATRYQRVNTASDYDTAGFPMYLRFDGVDDGMLTAAINFTATDKMTVWAGLHKVTDAAAFPVVYELGTTPRTLSLYQNSGAGGDKYATSVTGTSDSFGAAGPVMPAPATSVIAVSTNITGATRALAIQQRINQIAYALTGGSDVAPGGTNFGNLPLYIGSRAGTSLFLNGRIYSLIIRGAASSAAEIAVGERYVANKTGVTL